MHLVRTKPQPPAPPFEPVPGCSTCAMWIRLCANAWRIGGPGMWLHFDAQAEEQHGAAHEAPAAI